MFWFDPGCVSACALGITSPRTGGGDESVTTGWHCVTNDTASLSAAPPESVLTLAGDKMEGTLSLFHSHHVVYIPWNTFAGGGDGGPSVYTESSRGGVLVF